MKTKGIYLTIGNTIVLIPDTLMASHDLVGINTILLKETKGVALIDKPVFFSLKIYFIYLASRLLSTLVLGKKKQIAFILKEELVLKVSCLNPSNF
jgi:hypothetical protein